jgi:hypothetical protein
LVTEGSRPFFPWLSLAVDGKNGTVLGDELKNSQSHTFEQAAGQCLMNTLTKLKCLPREIAVRRNSLAVALAPICAATETAVFQVSLLPWLDIAYRSLRRGIMESHRRTG